MKFILHWILVALVFYALPYMPYVGDHFRIADFTVAIIAAAVFGLVNALVKPVLKVITLPLTVLTFGLFAFVLNIILFWAISWFIDGFDVPTLIGAVAGAVILSVADWLIDMVLE